MRRMSRPFRALLALASIGCFAGVTLGGDRATTGARFDDVAEAVARFESEDRASWQLPGDLMRVLSIVRGQAIADLGTGTGFFLPYLSAGVGEFGKVYAIDIEQGLLDYIGERQDIPFDNVETILARPDDPSLPENAVDLVLVVNTWHHIDKRRRYLPKLAEAVRPGGRIAIVDWVAEDTPIGPPKKHRLPRADVRREFERAGWDLVAESALLPYQYVLVFMSSEEARPQPIPEIVDP